MAKTDQQQKKYKEAIVHILLAVKDTNMIRKSLHPIIFT